MFVFTFLYKNENSLKKNRPAVDAAKGCGKLPLLESKEGYELNSLKCFQVFSAAAIDGIKTCCKLSRSCVGAGKPKTTREKMIKGG